MITFLFGRSRKEDFVITKSLYIQQKRANALYTLKQALSPKGQKKIYTTFKNPEPFLVDMPLKGKEKEHSEKLIRLLTISSDQADELALAKKLGCRLVITNKQLWLTSAAKKAGVKTKVFR